MPPEKRLRSNQERSPGRALEQTAGRGEEHAVPATEPGARDLAAEDPKLVPEHDFGGSPET